MATHEASRVEVPKPHRFSGNRDAKELDNFLWHMERYFEAITLMDETAKVRTATLYLIDTTTLWWRRRFADMEKDICTIETWEDFKRQFYPEDVAYLARKNMRHLKHAGSIHDYVKEFSSLMLEIPNMTEKELLFNFMDNLQGWAEQELRHRGVQDLATAMAVAKSLTDYKKGDSSKVESLEDSHAMGGGDKVPRDHNAPKKGSGKMPNVREGRGLHPSEASWEKEVKNILAKRVTRRQGVPLVIEYLVRWKGLPKRQVSWEHADALRKFWKHIERFQNEATTRTSTTSVGESVTICFK
ncbi:hypothetical protein CK203_106306 [Vitis vinifera]|uniref:Chromo domain-containing protein n=1 Tax=Vitis vinifera TaxID=29760 RepID=A0A438DJM4_VITVI|nr:hypothetical protein CK203_106306 [Vitis vinifera]